MTLDLTEDEVELVLIHRINKGLEENWDRMTKNAIADDRLLSGSNSEEHRANVARYRREGYGSREINSVARRDR